METFLSQFVYSEVFKLYFPRTPEEEQLSMNVLPLDLGEHMYSMYWYMYSMYWYMYSMYWYVVVANEPS